MLFEPRRIPFLSIQV